MYLVFDIGGSSTKYALIENDKIIKKYSEKSLSSMEEFLSFLKAKTEEFIKDYDIEGIGFSSPGTVDSKTYHVGGLTALGYLGEKDFAKVIKETYKLPVAIENDANCAALGEIYYNNPTENLLAFVIIGSGIGGAVVKDGEILRGLSLESGEFGYMLFNDYGEVKNLSRLGTLPNVRMTIKEKYGKDYDTYYIFDKYLKKEEPFYKEVDKMFTYLAMGLYNIAYSLNPEVIYIGGAISEDKNFVRALEEKLKEDIFAGVSLKLRPVSFFNDNNLYGAYANLKMLIEKEGGYHD